MRISQGTYPSQQWLDAWEVAAAQVAMETGAYVEVCKEYAAPATTTTTGTAGYIIGTAGYTIPYAITTGSGSGCAMPYVSTNTSTSSTSTATNTTTNTVPSVPSVITYIPANPINYYSHLPILVRIFFKWENMEFETLPKLKKALELKSFV